MRRKLFVPTIALIALGATVALSARDRAQNRAKDKSPVVTVEQPKLQAAPVDRPTPPAETPKTQSADPELNMPKLNIAQLQSKLSEAGVPASLLNGPTFDNAARKASGDADLMLSLFEDHIVEPELTRQAAGAPANDTCAGAITLSPGDTDSGDTTAATPEVLPACTTTDGTGGAVWYTTTGDGTVFTASLCGSAFDTKIRVYEGGCGSESCVAGNDDSCGLQSEVSWSATSGTQYWIVVHGFGSGAGAYTIALSSASPPPNNTCDDALTALDGVTAGTNVLATADGGTTACVFDGVNDANVWYSYTATCDGTLTASSCEELGGGADFDTRIAIFEGACGSESEIGCDDDDGDNPCGGSAGGFHSTAFAPVSAGTDYLITVGGFNPGAQGDFDLLLFCDPLQPTVINEIRGDDVGADDEEYFELCGEPGASLDGLSYIVIGDGSGGNSGVIESVTSLDGNVIPAGGYFLTAPVALLPLTGRIPDLVAPLTFENGDNVTHFLVQDFTGSSGDDLDAEDDCVLDEPVPWSAELDRVALIEVENGVGGPGPGNECHYGPPSVGPDAVASFPTSPGHVGRCEDCTGGWAQLDFFPDCGAPVGEVCATDADCEGFGCSVPSLCDAGTLTCLPACTADGDCPSGVCNTNGLCSESDTPGLPNVAAVCPVGSCCRVDGVCQDVFDAADCDEAGGAIYTEGGLCSETVCPPANNECADREDITDGTTPFTNIGATTDGPEEPSCDGDFGGTNNDVHNDVWFNYTATCTGETLFTVCDELGGAVDFDTRMTVYDGCDCPTTTAPIACNDDDPNNLCGVTIFASTLQIPTMQDNCYKVRIGGFSPFDVGSGVLNTVCIDTGGCCLPEDLTCQEDTTLDDCTAAGGEFLGFGSTCEGVTCGGACCLDDAELSCQQVFDTAACDALGGAFSGSGSDCESTTCGGACCLDGQVCQQTFDQPTCGMMGGTFNLVGSSCDTTICGGACCINCDAGDATCINTDNFFECSGEYQGDGTACGVNESCGECACPLSECDTLNQTAIAFNSGAVRCASGIGTTDNSFARCFDLAAEQGGATSAIITSVTYIAGESDDGGDGLPENWEVDINIYESPGCPPSIGTATLVHSEVTFLTNADENTTQTVALPNIAVSGFVVVEIRAPINGSVTPPDNYFFSAGQNEAGECADTYILANGCGITDWTPYAGIGFPGRALVLDVGIACCGDGVLEGDEECEQEEALLTNGSFDDNGGSFDGWFTFGNAFLSNADADPPEPFLSAPVAGKMFGQFNGQFNVGGVGQAFPAVAGESFVFDGSTFVWSNDPMVGDGPGGDPQGNWGLMKIAFFDAPAGGTEIGFEEILVADGTVAQDVWTPYSLGATAPAGTQRVEALFLYLQPEFDGGAYFFDNASFSRTNACCTAECTYEGAGTVCAAGDDAGCVAEAVCDGASAGCPAGGPAAGGTECRASAGSCDVAESCDGQNLGCPADEVEPGGTVCNPGTGTGCLEDALCDGTNVTCPPNAPIVDCIDGDGCCAPGCNQTQDSDCIAVCGNGRVEDGEECDDGNLDNGDGCDENCLLEPPAVPTVTEWGMICLMLALLAGIAVVFGRRRQVV